MLLNYVLIASLYIYNCDSLCVSKPSSAGQASILPDFLPTGFSCIYRLSIKLQNHSLGSPVYLIKNLIGLPASILIFRLMNSGPQKLEGKRRRISQRSKQ